MSTETIANVDAVTPPAPIVHSQDIYDLVPGVWIIPDHRIPLVPNARRFKAGHRIRLHLTSDDQDPQAPAIMGFRHATVGTSTINSIRSESRLLLPFLPQRE